MKYAIKGISKKAMTAVLLLGLPALFAPMIAWDAPIFCKVNGHTYAPAIAAMLGMSRPGPFDSTMKAKEIIENDKDAFAIWPLLPFSPFETGGEILVSPSVKHPLGTDAVGCDIAAQIIHGARSSLMVALIAGLFALAIGLPLGAMAGFFSGWLDSILSRLAEVVAAFPAFFLVLAVMAWHGPDLLLLSILLGITRWVSIFRYSRAEFMRLKERDYVAAAKAMGMGKTKIMDSEILPNAWGPILVSLAFLLSGTVLLEAGLSWIGLGLNPESHVSWGHMLQKAHVNRLSASHLLWPPAIAVFLMVISWNTIGEAIRKKLDTRR